MTRKQLLIRSGSILMMVSAALLGITWNKTGLCLGDSFFSFLGLPVWSQGTQGIHYPAIIGLILLLVSFFLFGSTTADSRKTVRTLIWGTLGGMAVLSLLFSIM